MAGTKSSNKEKSKSKRRSQRIKKTTDFWSPVQPNTQTVKTNQPSDVEDESNSINRAESSFKSSIDKMGLIIEKMRKENESLSQQVRTLINALVCSMPSSSPLCETRLMAYDAFSDAQKVKVLEARVSELEQENAILKERDKQHRMEELVEEQFPANHLVCELVDEHIGVEQEARHEQMNPFSHGGLCPITPLFDTEQLSWIGKSANENTDLDEIYQAWMDSFSDPLTLKATESPDLKP